MTETLFPLRHPESHENMARISNMKGCWFDEPTGEVYKPVIIDRMNPRDGTGRWLDNEDTDWFVLLMLMGFAGGWKSDG
jgi:hypothetical protein